MRNYGSLPSPTEMWLPETDKCTMPEIKGYVCVCVCLSICHILMDKNKSTSLGVQLSKCRGSFLVAVTG